MQLFWKETKGILTKTPNKTYYGDIPFSPGTVGVSAFLGTDTGSRGSSSPSLESQYLSSVESFGSPPTTSAPQECVSATGVVGVGGGSTGTGAGVDMPSSFVPTVTAITTSQDLQWMVQPTLISSVAPGQSSTGSSTMTQPVALDPYDLPGPSFSSGGGFTPPSSDTPGTVRQSRSRRRARDETLTPEEEEKRRVRRERNKQAAAKCRNRRRELTDRLQSETDMLEEEKAELEAEISELQKEKERLEFVLVAHQPGCKIPYQDQPPVPLPLPLPLPLPQTSLQTPSASVVGLSVKEDTFYLPPAYSSHHHHHIPVSQPTQTQPAPAQQQQGMMQEVAFSSSFYGQGQPAPDGPCLVADGGGNPDTGSYIPSYTSSFVFTYPEGACGASANQRTSSSDQSSDSLNSPSLLAL
ncbi:protein fosB-like isoform X1 [Sinocyclocheilus anshuiensis]|uniref:protein fosB-like isoform X1 n=1 Tax=Sinocyclocheilus anshuiensis TaxID=1608454 RepID=UPI0007B95C1E|nr:PREDICTED: protein fosB-like isoform X1 [Sinocyclocheilus anshuiensis]